jgi:hypothetical protein
MKAMTHDELDAKYPRAFFGMVEVFRQRTRTRSSDPVMDQGWEFFIDPSEEDEGYVVVTVEQAKALIANLQEAIAYAERLEINAHDRS